MTEVDIAQELVEMGVPKEDMSWDYIHLINVRIQNTEYGVA